MVRWVTDMFYRPKRFEHNRQRVEREASQVRVGGERLQGSFKRKNVHLFGKIWKYF